MSAHAQVAAMHSGGLGDGWNLPPSLCTRYCNIYRPGLGMTCASVDKFAFKVVLLQLSDSGPDSDSCAHLKTP